MKRAVREELRAFGLALQFLTRLPAPVSEAHSPKRLAASVRHYPLVGALVGALCAGVFWLADLALPSVVAVLLAVAAGLALTGGLHEDGLADSFDGIGAGSGNRGDSQRDRILEVMRDSRLGVFGATALVMALAIKAAALASLPPMAVGLALIAGHGLSRLACIVVMQTSNYLRTPTGQGASVDEKPGVAAPLAGRLGLWSWLTAIATGAALLAGLTLLLGPLAASLAFAGSLAGLAIMRLVLERRLGGYTGDTLGAVQQASEIGLYLGILASADGWA